EVVPRIDAEFLLSRFVSRYPFAVVSFRNLKDRIKRNREAHPGDGGHLLGHHVDAGQCEQDHSDQPQSHRYLPARDVEVERDFPFASFRLLITKHQHRQSFHGKAPYDAEGIRFAKQIDIASADYDGHQLQDHDYVIYTLRGADTVVCMPEASCMHVCMSDDAG